FLEPLVLPGFVKPRSADVKIASLIAILRIDGFAFEQVVRKFPQTVEQIAAQDVGNDAVSELDELVAFVQRFVTGKDGHGDGGSYPVEGVISRISPSFYDARGQRKGGSCGSDSSAPGASRTITSRASRNSSARSSGSATST